jgi:inorganic pyrophosphatase
MANLQRLTPVDRGGRIRAVLESPQGSKNKLKYVPAWDAFEVGASLPAGLAFPFDFGFLPGTRAADGDPLDILVLMDAPAYPGCVVSVRLLGAIEAEQRDGDSRTYRNDRLIGVAEGSTQRGDPHRLADLDDHLLDEIESFFATYDGLRGKSFQPVGRIGPDGARELLDRARINGKPQRRRTR